MSKLSYLLRDATPNSVRRFASLWPSARAYGIKVTDEAIRNNPNLKRNVCQSIGRDNRVFIACVDANSFGRRGY